MPREKVYYNKREEIDSSKNEFDDLNFNSRKTETIPAEVESNGPETKNGIVVNTIFVKVRERPNYESNVLEILNCGDKVHIIDQIGDFYKVSTKKNNIAYISSHFIKEE